MRKKYTIKKPSSIEKEKEKETPLNQ